MKSSHRYLTVCFIVSISTLLSCSPRTAIRSEEIIGKWSLANASKKFIENERDPVNYPLSKEVTFTIRADGTLDFHGYPPFNDLKFLSGVGTWKIAPEGRSVLFLINEPGNRGTSFELQSIARGNKRVLYSYWSDPDDGRTIEFEKEP